jgi:hypothetical protein
VICVFENRRDAQRVREVVAQRLAPYGLTLHPTQTHLVDLRGGAGPRPHVR